MYSWKELRQCFCGPAGFLSGWCRSLRRWTPTPITFMISAPALFASCKRDMTSLDSLEQLQTYCPLAVITKTEDRMQGMRSKLRSYYRRHPHKALLRLRSTLTVRNVLSVV